MRREIVVGVEVLQTCHQRQRCRGTAVRASCVTHDQRFQHRGFLYVVAGVDGCRRVTPRFVARSDVLLFAGATRRKLIEEVEGTSVGALGFVITVTEVSKAAPHPTAPYRAVLLIDDLTIPQQIGTAYTGYFSVNVCVYGVSCMTEDKGHALKGGKATLGCPWCKRKLPRVENGFAHVGRELSCLYCVARTVSVYLFLPGTRG